MKANIRKRLFGWCPQPKTSAPESLTRLSQLWKRARLVYVIPVTLLVAAIVGLLIFMSTYVGPGSVRVSVTTEKQSYLPGEEIQFRIDVYNPNIWQVRYPTTMTYEIFDQNGTRVEPGCTSSQGGNPVPALQKLQYHTYVWDQVTGMVSERGLHRTQVPCGNYTFYATLGGIQLAPVLMNHTNTLNNDSYEPNNPQKRGSCTIEIRPNP